MVSQMTRLAAATISSLTNLELPWNFLGTQKPTSIPLQFRLSYLHYRTISVCLFENGSKHKFSIMNDL